MIIAENLHKTYHKKIAVNNASFSVQLGKVTGFLGPNGAGKSTTMRLMLGFDSGRGKTTYSGKHLNDYRNPMTIVGILLESKAFHPTRSAFNHLRILAAPNNISNERINEVLEIVGLREVAKNKPGTFSLGMSQRLGIASAILSKPRYLFLDEPANGLDPEGIVWLRRFIRDYASAGNAVFVSSHLLSEMSQIADNVVIIGKGSILMNTSMTQLLDSGARSEVFVRSPLSHKLKTILGREKYHFNSNKEGITVSGITTDELGALMFEHKLPIHELTVHKATLEQTFLDITSSYEEFTSIGSGE